MAPSLPRSAASSPCFEAHPGLEADAELERSPSDLEAEPGKYLSTIRTLSRAAMARPRPRPQLLVRTLSSDSKLRGSSKQEEVAAKPARRKPAGQIKSSAGSNRNPATGEVEWPSDILESGSLLRDFGNVEATGLRTVRSVLKISSRHGLQRRGGKRTIEDDDFDPRAIGQQTRFLESYVESLHSDYMAMLGNARLPMHMHQFRRFVRVMGFHDSFIVKRMFETFDVDHNNCLNFVELLVGLTFFMDREKRSSILHPEDGEIYNHPVFIEFCTKFFDLDGHERMSKFKLFKVCSTCLSKAEATLYSDAIYEMISGTVETITLQRFKECLKGSVTLRHILRLLMVLQGTPMGTAAYNTVYSELSEVASEWVTLKKSGRSVSMEQVIRATVGASDDKMAELSATAEDFQQARHGMDAVYASYYVQVLRGLIENGKEHVATEYSRIKESLNDDASFQVVGKARELLMVETAILEGFHECLGMPCDFKMTKQFRTPKPNASDPRSPTNKGSKKKRVSIGLSTLSQSINH